MDWIPIGSTGLPMAFLDIWDGIEGMAAGLGIIALYAIIKSIIDAVRAKRKSAPGA
jgi:hypothetical protein